MGQEQSALIEEGSAKIYFPSNIDRSEVFYNPVQKFNRDLTCLVLQTFNEKQGSPTKLFEAFSATGLRSIRYAKEVTGFSKIIANDIDPNAVKIIERNIKANGVTGTVESSIGDANKIMNQHVKEFQIIDLDPYSTASIFLESAIQAVTNCGLMCVTSTDGRTLCGHQQETSFAWYNVMLLPTEFCHEFGIRALLTTMRTIAAKYKKTIEPMLCLAANFYFRVFVRVWDKSPNDIGLTNALVFYSTDTRLFWLQPIARETVKGKERHVKPATVTVPGFNDPYTGNPCTVGGPVYTGPIQNKEFIQKLLDNMPKMKFITTNARIEAVLNCCIRELDAPFYYDISSLTGVIKSATPSIPILVTMLEKLGYHTSLTHTKPGMLKTDAPGELMYDILRKWYFHTGKKMPEQPGVQLSVLQAKGREIDLEFEEDPEVKERIKKEKEICKYYLNPEKNYGPKPAAKPKGKKK